MSSRMGQFTYEYCFLLTENVSMEAFQIVGHTNASYMCHSLTFHFKTEQYGFIYRADWRMRDFHVQAFNLENNTYSLGEYQ